MLFLLLLFIWHLPSVSEANLNSGTHSPALDFDGCSPPWKQSGFSNSCYLLGEKTMTWDEGWDFCDDNGGYLLEVDSEQEYLDLLGRFGLVLFGLVWFGLIWFGLVWFGLISV